MKKMSTAYFHLPGLFEFFELYKVFLPLWKKHRIWFYEWAEISSVYGSPEGCLWGGGRTGNGDADPLEVLSLMNEYGISSRLTFSNSLLKKEHLEDKKCNKLCKIFSEKNTPRASHVKNGVIIYSDLLKDYIKEKYPELYLVSSTTKVITDFDEFKAELDEKTFDFVVPDFRLNKEFSKLSELSKNQKDKVEFLCNECCDFKCKNRKKCYENVSRKNLGEDVEDFSCTAGNAEDGYRFSLAMKNKSFIGINDIKDTYLPMGFSNFKIEGRGLGSAVVLEFLLYYITKPEYQLEVREAVYLDSMLDLF